MGIQYQQANPARPAVFTNDFRLGHTSSIYDMAYLGYFTHRRSLVFAYDFSVQPYISSCQCTNHYDNHITYKGKLQDAIHPTTLEVRDFLLQ